MMNRSIGEVWFLVTCLKNKKSTVASHVWTFCFSVVFGLERVANMLHTSRLDSELRGSLSGFASAEKKVRVCLDIGQNVKYTNV